jgi:hypothetical protein
MHKSSRCLNCGYEGETINFLNYQESNYPKERCPSCDSENVVEKKAEVSIPVVVGRMCPFCGKKEIKYFSFNSTSEDLYFSENLVCCEDDECKEALRKKVNTYNNAPTLVLISSFSVLMFYPKIRKKAQKFFESISKNGRKRKITSKTISSHPR